MKCPLNSQEIPNLKEPLEDLTADKARDCVKIFEGLPYSPLEANRAREIAEKISEHARLGFTQVTLPYAISDKMKTTLESRGFQVMLRHRFKIDDSTYQLLGCRYPKEPRTREDVSIYVWTKIESHTDLSWSCEPIKHLEDWSTDWEKTWTEAKAAEQDCVDKFMAEQEEQFKKKDTLGPYEVLPSRPTSTPSSGCLPLVLIGLTLTIGGVVSAIIC